MIAPATTSAAYAPTSVGLARTWPVAKRKDRVAVEHRMRGPDAARQPVVSHLRHLVHLLLVQLSVRGNHSDHRGAPIRSARRPVAERMVASVLAKRPSCAVFPPGCWPCSSITSPKGLTAINAATTSPPPSVDRPRCRCRSWSRALRQGFCPHCTLHLHPRSPQRLGCRSRRPPPDTPSPASGNASGLPSARSNRMAAGTIGTRTLPAL